LSDVIAFAFPLIRITSCRDPPDPDVENLFSPVRAMNLDTWAARKHILNEYSRLNGRLHKAT